MPFAVFRETLTWLQGFMHPGDPFTTGPVLPEIRRPILSWSSPSSRNLPLEPWFFTSEEPPPMGFITTLDESIAMTALQSFKELEVRTIFFETGHPPWGLCPVCLG
jgi:hypothetical protein